MMDSDMKYPYPFTPDEYQVSLYVDVAVVLDVENIQIRMLYHSHRHTPRLETR